MYRSTDLMKQVRFEPDVARARIRLALRKHHGNLVQTARELDVHRRTLYRMIEHLGLQPFVERVRRPALFKAERQKTRRPA